MTTTISRSCSVPLLLAAFGSVGCARDDIATAYGDAAGASSATPELSTFESFDSDFSCPGSGVRFLAGVDENRNGVLDTDEVQKTEVVCDAVATSTQLTRVVAVAPGDDCSVGGLAVHQGTDTNLNGYLDDEEILGTDTVCTAAPRAALLSRTDPAELAACPNGGTQFSFGEDTNENNYLDDFEVASSSSVCNAAASCPPVIHNEVIAPGATCAEGGTQVMVGQDNGGPFQVPELSCDGRLDDSEIDDQVVLCNGNSGNEGLQSLVELRDAPAGRCVGDGVEIVVGIDDDRSGTLSDEEIDQTELLCPEGANFVLETGIRTDRSLAALEAEGWSICFEKLYNQSGSDVGGAGIKAACQTAGQYLMIGCANHTIDNDRLVVSASDLATVVIPAVDDLAGGANHRVADGNVGWYFTTSSSSIGFFEAGDGLQRHSADIATGAFPERRLSWHTHTHVGGYRCGATTTLNSNANWKKYILAHD